MFFKNNGIFLTHKKRHTKSDENYTKKPRIKSLQTKTTQNCNENKK